MRLKDIKPGRMYLTTWGPAKAIRKHNSRPPSFVVEAGGRTFYAKGRDVVEELPLPVAEEPTPETEPFEPMTVKEIIAVLARYPDTAMVRVGIEGPDGFTDAHVKSVAAYPDGPVLRAHAYEQTS